MLFAAILTLGMGTATEVHGQEFVQTNEFFLDTNTVFSSELWLSAPVTTLAGSTSNDVLAYSAKAQISGEIAGDLWIAAQESIHFSGYVRQNARMAGLQTLTVDGRIAGNLLAFSRSVVLETNALVEGTSYLGGRHIQIRGRHKQDVHLKAVEATVTGHFDNNLRIQAQTINLLAGTVVEGDLIYSSPEELTPPDSVRIEGTIERRPFAQGTQGSPVGALILPLTLLGSALVTTTVALWLFPGVTGNAVRTLRQNHWECLLMGLIGVFGVPFFGVVLLFSGIGFSLGLLLLCLLVPLLYMAQLPVALVVGSFLLRRRGPQPFRRAWQALTLGLGLLYILLLVPLLGPLVWLIILVHGTGAWIRTLKSAWQPRE